VTKHYVKHSPNREHFYKDRYANTAVLENLCWECKENSHNIAVNSQLSGDEIDQYCTRLLKRMSSNEIQLYTEREDRRGHFIKVYKGINKIPLGVRTKLDEVYLKGILQYEEEYDILKVVQWLDNWEECTNIYKIDIGLFRTFLRDIDNYGNQDKLFNLHFGGEYNLDSKSKFKAYLKSMIKDTLQHDEVGFVSISMNPNNSNGNTLPMED
jgi:hypothetical protein